ncbi:hypothetical protein FHS57_001639 [Runella defluvii]|uniref:Ribbon-helix-helix protein, CopG family n=1 Tax=Runella defluvii TaxID=370973 RepID=A0A7W5ZKS5_9BACT|nr:hypothetical protein [Runella defluvii]MBB3837642.1 hypothetical protein [Runella defluvii]
MKNQVITLRADTSTKELLKELSAEYSLSESECIRQAIFSLQSAKENAVKYDELLRKWNATNHLLTSTSIRLRQYEENDVLDALFVRAKGMEINGKIISTKKDILTLLISKAEIRINDANENSTEGAIDVPIIELEASPVVIQESEPFTWAMAVELTKRYRLLIGTLLLGLIMVLYWRWTWMLSKRPRIVEVFKEKKESDVKK